MLRQAQNYLLRGAPRKAAALYGKWLSARPADHGAWLWRAAALAEAGRFPEAREHLDRAAALRPSSPAGRIFRARVLFDAGQFEEVRDLLGSMEGRADENHHARSLLAACLIRLGDARAAQQVLPASLPSAPGVLARLLTAIEAAHPEPPGLPEPLPEVAGRGSRRSLRRGLVLLRAERWPEAYQAFRRAENAGLTDPKAGFGLGLSLYYLGRPEESQACLLAVLDRLDEPFHSDALAALGKADLDLGRLESAVVRLRRAIVRGARFPDNYYALGLALLRRGRPDLARKAFQGCVSPPFVRQRFLQLAGK